MSSLLQLPLQVVHVWGSPYDMGFAQGELMTAELQAFVPEVYDYLVTQVLGKATNNTALANAIKAGVEVALDLSYDRTKDFVKPYVPALLSLCEGIHACVLRLSSW